MKITTCIPHTAYTLTNFSPINFLKLYFEFFPISPPVREVHGVGGWAGSFSGNTPSEVGLRQAPSKGVFSSRFETQTLLESDWVPDEEFANDWTKYQGGRQ